jgi:hypothetical protein
MAKSEPITITIQADATLTNLNAAFEEACLKKNYFLLSFFSMVIAARLIANSTVDITERVDLVKIFVRIRKILVQFIGGR